MHAMNILEAADGLIMAGCQLIQHLNFATTPVSMSIQEDFRTPAFKDTRRLLKVAPAGT